MGIAVGIILGGIGGFVAALILTFVLAAGLGIGGGVLAVVQLACIGGGAFLGYRMATRPSSY